MELKKGKTWAATKDVIETESRIRHTSKDIVGTVVAVVGGRQRLGTSEGCYLRNVNT